MYLLHLASQDYPFCVAFSRRLLLAPAVHHDLIPFGLQYLTPTIFLHFFIWRQTQWRFSRLSCSFFPPLLPPRRRTFVRNIVRWDVRSAWNLVEIVSIPQNAVTDRTKSTTFAAMWATAAPVRKLNQPAWWVLATRTKQGRPRTLH